MSVFSLITKLGGSAPSEWSLERLLTDPDGFGLTSASDTQRAICRCLDGEPDASCPELFGGADATAALPRVRPSEAIILAGIRGGKSLLCACCAVRAALTCQLGHLGPGEVPRVSVVSLSVDVAKATFAHIRGRIEASAVLRPLLIGQPLADSLQLRHPSGRPVEIKVVAGSRAAGSLVARWSAGAIFDEAPRMLGQADGVVNLDDALTALRGRLLPGAQVLMPGSPWAPFGPIYNLVQERFGKPGPDLVVMRATGPQMNPLHWTPERCEAERRKDPDGYRVNVECGFLAPETAMFGLAELERAATDPPREPDERRRYIAAMDPATRGNAWTLVVVSKNDDGEIECALARQWIGSAAAPLSPRSVLREIAAAVMPYRIRSIATDQWAMDPLRDLALPEGIYLDLQNTSSTRRTELYETVRAYLADDKLRLPNDSALLRDLSVVRKRVTQQAISIELPTTSDGRHADYAAALALACGQFLPAPLPKPAEPTERDYAEARKKELAARLQKQQKRDGWRMPP